MKHRIEELNSKSPGWLKTGEDAASLPTGQSLPIRYTCPVCEESYADPREAVDCKYQPWDTGGLSVGDIIVVPGAYHNSYDLDDPWVAFQIPPDEESKSHFDRAGYMVPFYVVTSLHQDDRDKHRCLVTLMTLAGDRLHGGYNPANGDGHHSMYRPGKDFHIGSHNSYWLESMQSQLDACVPSEKLKKEAAELAAIGISTRVLL